MNETPRFRRNSLVVPLLMVQSVGNAARVEDHGQNQQDARNHRRQIIGNLLRWRERARSPFNEVWQKDDE